MLVLPIKKKWFDMIKSGEKKEEYREIKPYYHSRLGHYFICYRLDTSIRKVLRNMTTAEKIIIFRNGYSHNSPQIKCRCTLRVGQGKEEWGAELGKEYYVLEILKILEETNENTQEN